MWISPVVAQLSTMTPYGLPYHGYWPQDSYSINPKFGTAADLKALSAALHKRGMYLMVDVVPNHSAYNGAPSAVDYSKFNPFNKASYYHSPYCAIDYSNTTSITQCWMGDQTVSLPDLKTENPAVQTMWNSWVSQFVANYSIDGLRIDSAMQMNKDFFPTFVSSSGVYAMGEVVNGGPTFLCDYQNYMPGVLNYAYYYWVIRAFGSSSATMTELANNIQWLNSTCKDTTLLGNFLENHDQPRFPSMTTDAGLIENAIAFNIMSDGIPIVYYGQEQGFSGATDPYNREPLWPSGYKTSTTLYQLIGKLNAIRNWVISRDSTYSSTRGSIIYSDTKTLVTMKYGSGSKVISVFTNDGAGAASRTVTISKAKTSFPANTGFMDIVSCKEFKTDSNGDLAITVNSGLPMVLFHTNGLTGGTLCQNSASTAAPTSVALTTVTPPSTMSSAAKAAPTSATSLSTAPLAKSTSATVSCPSSNNTQVTSNGRIFVIECGVDRAGGDIQMVYVNNLNQCLDTCALNANCVDVSLSGNACYLKSTLNAPVYGSVLGARLLAANSVSSSASKTSTSSTSTSCTPLPSTIVTFTVNATTNWGQGVYLTGSTRELNSWNTSYALTMDASTYPVWSLNVTFPANEYVEYKYIKAASGQIVWEGGSNRNFTVPATSSCVKGGTVRAESWVSQGQIYAGM